MNLLLLMGVLVLAVWFWGESRRAHEQAVAACIKACRHHDVQLLDATVALSALRPVRSRGGLRIRRTYQFHFSIDGVTRTIGTIQMLGGELLAIDFGALLDDLQ